MRRLAVVVALVIAVLSFVVSEAFLNPTDALVYLAAGERLNAGHELYSLQPGDRPIQLNPPYWTVPTLSPPLLGVAWRPLALLGTAGIWVGWAMTGAVYLAALAILVRFTPMWGALVVALLAPNIGHQLAIGNVNGLLALGVVALWVFRDRAWIVGGLLAAMVLIKVTPIVLVVWLLATHRYKALLATAMCGLILTALSILGAGLDAHFQYVSVATNTIGDGTTDASISGVLRQLGMSSSLARVAPWLLIGIGLLLLLQWHRADGRGFALAVVLMTVGSPAFNPYWLALTLFALVSYSLVQGRGGLDEPAQAPSRARPLGVRWGSGLR